MTLAIGFNGERMQHRLSTWISVGLGILGIVGCATGSDVSMRGGDGSGRDGGPGIDAAEPGVCDPPCEVGEMCAEGSCVPALDGDGDGVDSAFDCDDADPTVGPSGERLCTGACGEGLEVCEDGTWYECDAPTTCDCEPGSPPRSIACMRCGTQRQVCTDGMWVDDGTCTGAGPCSSGEIGTGGTCGNCGTEQRTCGADCTWGAWACEGEGVCAAGATEMEMETCGTCGTGSRMRTRTCDGSCGWGAWGAWGACVGGGSGVCTPGMTEMQTEACGNCGTGTRSRTRSCDATTCDWGPWGAFGACSGGGICAPGATSDCSPDDSCGQRVCSSTCTWSACQPIMPGGCLRRLGGTGVEGSNYRCCTLTPTDDGWQFCGSSCTWFPCAATTSC